MECDPRGQKGVISAEVGEEPENKRALGLNTKKRRRARQSLGPL